MSGNPLGNGNDLAQAWQSMMSSENLTEEDAVLFQQLQGILGRFQYDSTGMIVTPEMFNNLNTWMNNLMPNMPAFQVVEPATSPIRINYDELQANAINLLLPVEVEGEGTELSNRLRLYLDSIPEVNIMEVRTMVNRYFTNVSGDINDGNINKKHLTMEQVARLKTIEYHQFPLEKRIYDVCPIATDEFDDHDMITICPCNHYFKTPHITTWLTEFSDCCPYCKTVINF